MMINNPIYILLLFIYLFIYLFILPNKSEIIMQIYSLHGRYLQFLFQ